MATKKRILAHRPLGLRMAAPHEVETLTAAAAYPIAMSADQAQMFAQAAAEADPRYAPMGPALPDAVNTGRAINATSQTVKLIDGTLKRISTTTSSDGARPMGGYIIAPIQLQDADTVAARDIEDNAGASLAILGQASIGIDGCQYTVFFDVPLGQVCQYSVIAQSLDISARLIARPVPTIGVTNVFGNAWLYPPTWTGTLSAVLQADPFVIVQGMSGIGFSGMSNLTRRAFVDNTTKNTLCPAPDFATTCRVLAKSDATQSFLVANATAAIGPVPTDALERPLPAEGGCTLAVIPASASSVEIVWRLGLSGYPS